LKFRNATILPKECEMKRLPKIAVTGLFQTGKSLITNAILGGSCLPVGLFGLRTTPCVIECSYGSLDRVEIREQDGSVTVCGLRQMAAIQGSAPSQSRPKSIQAHLNRPILLEMGLLDTPGFDFDDCDDRAAQDALASADAAVLVVTQQLPAAIPAFERMVEALRRRPWAMVLNCGKSGPHLEDPNASASREVEDFCLGQLAQSGAGSPVFSQRLDGRALLSFARGEDSSPVRFPGSDEECPEIRDTEDSLDNLRDNLKKLGEVGICQLLEASEAKFRKIAVQNGATLEAISWKVEASRFSACIQSDSKQVRVSGSFELRQSGAKTNLILQKIKSTERWITDWLAEEIENKPWPIKPLK
jgi:hypothetical protein